MSDVSATSAQDGSSRNFYKVNVEMLLPDRMNPSIWNLIDVMKILFLVGGLFLISLFAQDITMSQYEESGKKIDEQITPIKSIGLSWILVEDLNESVKFYTEIVGLTLEHFDEPEGWAELSGSEGGTRLGIGQKRSYNEIHPGQNAIVSLPVEDILAAKAYLMKKGVHMLGEIIDYPGLLKLQTFIDHDGNCFQLIELIHDKP